MKKTVTPTFLLILIPLSFLVLSPNPVYAAAANLTLSPSSGAYEIGEIFELEIVLDTNGANSSGVDVILFYDADKIQAQEIVTGSIFAFYPYQSIDEQNGKLSVSALMAIGGEPFSGTGTLATLKLEALSTGTAELNFDFTPGERNDSNVADCSSQTDILSSITNGTYTIGSPTSTPSPALTPTPTPVPAAGAPEPTPTPTLALAPTATPTPIASPELKKGDINQDSKIDIFDLSRLLSKWGKTDNISSADLNHNGKVDIFDLSILLSNW